MLAQGRMNDKTGEDSDPQSNPWSDSGTAAMLAQSLAIDDGVQARGDGSVLPPPWNPALPVNSYSNFGWSIPCVR